MRTRLIELGTLKRASDPEPDLVAELFRANASKMCCPDCNRKLVVGRTYSEDDVDWGDERKCEACGKPISPARIEALPNALRCAVCQEKLDRGEAVGEADYCDYCGGIMVLRLTAGRSAGYSMRCSDCGR